MSVGPAAKRSSIARRLGRPVATLSVLIVLVSAGLSSLGSDSSTGAEATLGPSAAPGQVLLKSPPERSGPWADGAIDSFEEDDLSCEQSTPTPSEANGSRAPRNFRIPFFARGELAQPYPARGPPSA